jgi:hypothetical protein
MARWLRQWRILAVQDVYKVMPFADAMYGCDEKWWQIHKDCDGFAGEKWSTHQNGANDKLAVARDYGVRLVGGDHGCVFSLDPSSIHYGANSGFQAINLAILKGCKRIVLVGFDMRCVNGKAHFFGDHPKGLTRRTEYESFLTNFKMGAKHLPSDIRIVNATPDSALTCFKMKPLEIALADDLLHRDRPEPDAHASAGGAV